MKQNPTAAMVGKPVCLQPAFSNVLPELQAVPNWVLTRLILRDGRWTKPPLKPNGEMASSTDPLTWSTFDSVTSAYVSGGFDGIGFVLDGKPHFDGKYLHGFDWDHCIESEKLDPAVKAAIDKLKIPRLEMSISGTGVRGFFLHHDPLPSVRATISGRSVELYSNKRYMTTTGVGRGVLT